MDLNKLFSDFVSKVKGTQKSLPDFQFASSQVTSPVGNPLINALSQAKNNVTNFINNLPPQIAGANYNFRQAVLPHIPYTSPQQNQQEFDKWNQSSLADQSFMPNGNEFTTLQSFPLDEIGASGKLMPFFEAPQSDPRLNAVKQTVLNQFTPAYQSYLTNIPIVNQPAPVNVAGQAFGTYANPYEPNKIYDYTTGSRYINMANMPVASPSATTPYYQTSLGVASNLRHEFLHQAPRPFATKTDWINNINGILQKYPELYKTAASYTGGKGLPSPEEIYATLGQALGPMVMEYPELAPFYKNIFVPVK